MIRDEGIEATANRLPSDEAGTVPPQVIRECLADIERFLAGLAEMQRGGFDPGVYDLERAERSLKRGKSTLTNMLKPETCFPGMGFSARMALLDAARALVTPPKSRHIPNAWE